MKTTTFQLKHFVNRSSCRLALLLIPLALACLSALPTARAIAPALLDVCAPNFTAKGGCHALYELTTGVGNTAMGWHALAENSEASFSTSVGAGALLSNNGDSNTAVGAAALLLNTTGTENVAVGPAALLFNDGGSFNTVNGVSALSSNTTGSNNTANGWQALFSNTIGDANTAIGLNALPNNTSGSSNLALGNISGSSVITADNVICIGAYVTGADVSDTTWIGNVYGVTTQSGTTAPVVVSDSGQLGTVASSERFKKDIVTMEKASEAILLLRPVTFHYKTDTKSTPQFGLIAEEVAKVNPALVLPDKEGKPYSVRYDQVNAMLLNEFLKEHRKVQQLEANDVQQQSAIKALTAMVKEQAEQIQKVSAQLELSESAPRTVLNSQ